MKIFENLSQLIGNTPLLEINRIETGEELKAKILVKLESFNPGSSVKDRIARAMIEKAESTGTLLPGMTIIEPTSGNTGIGLAWVARSKGYKVILTMPETMSLERRNLLKALGAHLELTPGSEGMKGAIKRSEELNKEISGSIILQQFENAANPEVHYLTTGPEIWKDTDGTVDIIVAGVGTGGTISGSAKYLKEQNPNVKAVAVEPSSSAVISGLAPGPHKIQGIGAGFIPKNLNMAIIDEVIQVSDKEAVAASRMLAREEGVLAGISSGAALHAAIQLAKKKGNEDKTIVAILPDTGERYLSTILYDLEAFPT